ncbi:sugar ABC transporter permease [Conexibacter sp. JD483]|uniref:carbohydrate ABC transporter permease n=1 Tax=unclassified Conexibacter TaxID=2627773 RepID=UPI0027276BD0|nr:MULTISPECIES: sugar ABC transporter permease [unclassified Conexibacter]MDO8188258.1 sugar ABC transporter permease [Conexibacter sp. CPCC 205706]MDO8197387.1 sugar ABC transporter permease [Conexibacter sp. CPCC 205762]MDR9370163.1 sugar ABC transporter permease [Conexibacter sp. JD483]
MASTTLTQATGAPEQTAVRASEQPGPRRRKSPRAGGHWPFFALPAVVLVAVFFALPFLLNAGFAFSDWSGFSEEIGFNGVDNFRTLIDQEIFWPAVRTTLMYAGFMLVFAIGISLSLALLLEQTTRINTIFRSLFFVPVLISPLAAGYIWKGMLASNGPINGMLSFLLPGTVDTAWLGDPTTALPAVALIEAWKWSGLITLVYIAGLKAIPKEMLEAAMIDGANAWTRFWRIRLRMLAPALTFNVAVTLAIALMAYDVIAPTTAGGPGDHTTTLNIAMRLQWGQSFFGPASALSLTVAVLIVVSAVPLVMWMRKKEVN